MSFRLRLNNIDSYQALPTTLDPSLVAVRPESSEQRQSPKVPVIRIFGATETGQKVCAHVHGAFPYIYVEYPERKSLIPDDVDAYMRRLHLSVDHAMALSLRRNLDEPHNAFVAKIMFCKGVPFYGLSVGWKFYLKIYMLNPAHMTRLADLLRAGSIMGRTFQPYEAHIQYILQFMIDFNLFGCGFVDCEKVQFRAPVPSSEEAGPDQLWHDETISPEWIVDSDQFPRLSYCALEIDVQAYHIKNRRAITPRLLHHDFLERVTPLPADMKFVQSMAELWKDENRRQAVYGQSMENVPPMSAGRQRNRGDWIHEEEYMEMVSELIEAEKGGWPPRFDTYVKHKCKDKYQHTQFERFVQTTIDSVQDFFPEFEGDPIRKPGAIDNVLNGEGVEVDESKIANFEQTAPHAEAENNYDYDQDNSGDGYNLFELDETGRTYDTAPDGKFMRHIDENTLKVPEIIRTGDTEIQNMSNTYGIRSVNDSETDDFDIPQEFFSAVAPKQSGASVGSGSPPKRQRLKKVTNFPESLNDGAALWRHSIGPPHCTSPSSQYSDENGHRKLLYQVVKYPDPETVLRLSQERIAQKLCMSRILEPLGNLPSSQHSSQPKPSFESFVFNDEIFSSQVFSEAKTQEIACRISQEFCVSSKVYCYNSMAPPNANILESLEKIGLPRVIYQKPYYSKETDVPARAREYAGKEFKLVSKGIPFLRDFDPSGDGTGNLRSVKKRLCQPTIRVWEIMEPPPSKQETSQWLEMNMGRKSTSTEVKIDATQENTHESNTTALSQIEAPTQKNRHGFKFSQKAKSRNVQHEAQYMSIMSLEVHVNTRGDLNPDPEQDEVSAVFWCLQSDDDQVASNGIKEGYHIGVLVVSSDQKGLAEKFRSCTTDIDEEDSELDLLTRIVDIVRQYDPDILTGYEVHSGSWGYLIERARVKYDYNLCDEFSRMKAQSHGRFGRDNDKWGFNHASSIRITGRHLINIWRAMKGELNLLQYTMENVAFHLLHRRIPHYSHRDLTSWWKSEKPNLQSRLLRYYLLRVQLNLEILDRNELVVRTSEQARLLGIDFFSVFSRGSQFKVEAIMFRIAKPECYMLISPSKAQVGQQNALECLPLVMEPQSAFYNSPVVVLDFQSLYPSIMIAYNYCYSTCLGRVVNWRGQNKLGFINYQREHKLLELLKDHIIVAPNGILYVAPTVRKSLLAKMLTEILETRVMVKNGMKQDKHDKALQQLLNNRQLALKLIANVTYGYTSATFSGRMPCAEVADSIVQSGRETLEKAIALIHSNEDWKAEVVYGDTDSLFISLPGRTRDEAFRIGDNIAKQVTAMNPKPIKLKFEKVYHPCILLAKKRYVGFKYEHPDQKEPDFDAKGIETIRRDGTPAQQKITEKCLKIFFRTADLSAVKEYLLRQFTKILLEKVSLQDFCFAKEVRLGTYSDRAPPPPGAIIAAQKMAKDPRAEPQYGERVPFIVRARAPGARVYEKVIPPEVLLNDGTARLDSEYYITRNIIPPLTRIFNLVGADVERWYQEMPKIHRILRNAEEIHPAEAENSELGKQKTKTLESYMRSSSCIICFGKIQNPPTASSITENSSTTIAKSMICPICLCDENRSYSLYVLSTRLSKAEKKMANINIVCRSCEGIAWNETVTGGVLGNGSSCDSKDCPVFFSRVRCASSLRADRAELGTAIGALKGLDETSLRRAPEIATRLLEW